MLASLGKWRFAGLGRASSETLGSQDSTLWNPNHFAEGGFCRIFCVLLDVPWNIIGTTISVSCKPYINSRDNLPGIRINRWGSTIRVEIAALYLNQEISALNPVDMLHDQIWIGACKLCGTVYYLVQTHRRRYFQNRAVPNSLYDISFRQI